MDVRFVQSLILEDDDSPGDAAVDEIVEIHSSNIYPAVLGKESFGRGGAKGAFPGKGHDCEFSIHWTKAIDTGMAASRTRQPPPRYPTPVPGKLKAEYDGHVRWFPRGTHYRPRNSRLPTCSN